MKTKEQLDAELDYLLRNYNHEEAIKEKQYIKRIFKEILDEIVGEDKKEVKFVDLFDKYITNSVIFGYNSAKAEIRNRITKLGL